MSSSVIELEVQIPYIKRLDRWLADQLPEHSRSRLQKLIEDGWVQINGATCTTKKAPIQAGDRVRLEIPPAEPTELKAQEIPLDVLYEDESMLIVNKPAGLVVHPGPGHTDGTLVNALLAHCQSFAQLSSLNIGGEQRPGIVHRLDRDTTGAMVVAKTDAALRHLQDQIRAKSARREYLGVVYGAPSCDRGSIDAPIGRHPVDRKKMAVVDNDEKGRRAVTHWQVKERLGNYTLIHFQLDTGRTHQIRVHSAHIGHPIVGDPMYGSGRSIGVNLEGQALHAWKLSLIHPVSEQPIQVTAPLPEEFERLLQILRRRAASS